MGGNVPIVNMKGSFPCWNMNPTTIVYDTLRNCVWEMKGCADVEFQVLKWNAVSGFPANTVDDGGSVTGDDGSGVEDGFEVDDFNERKFQHTKPTCMYLC